MDLRKPTGLHNPYLPSDSNMQLSSHHQVDTYLVNYNHVTYALAMFSYFTAGLTWIFPIVMNYLKRDEARGTWLYSHFDWQIKTFWYSVFFGAIAILLMVIGFGGLGIGILTGSVTVAGSTSLVGMVGLMMIIAVVLWHLYRVIRGWIALANRRAVP